MAHHKMRASQSEITSSRINSHFGDDAIFPNPLTQHGFLFIIYEPFEIISANASASRITGLAHEELRAFSQFQFLQNIHTDDRETVRNYLSTIKSRSESSEDIVRIYRKDNSSIKIESASLNLSATVFVTSPKMRTAKPGPGNGWR